MTRPFTIVGYAKAGSVVPLHRVVANDRRQHIPGITEALLCAVFSSRNLTVFGVVVLGYFVLRGAF